MGVSRRMLLGALGLCPALRVIAATPMSAARGDFNVAAAWQSGSRHFVGMLSLTPGAPARELAAIEVPTRPHGVWADRSGRIVAVARRPGDWMLRWRGAGHAPQWRWIEPLRAFNGHAVIGEDGTRLFTTETDLETGQGVIGVRDARTLEKAAEWPTLGTDPHQLLRDRLAPGHLVVANGGLTTMPETGRVKHDVERMDSSIVRIDARTGRAAGQWRLDDQRLSLRHLAWSHDGRRLGIAMQAEHDDARARAEAPVLAVFDGNALQAVAAPRALAGYGGDIAPTSDGFAVSCPRAGGIAHFSTAVPQSGAWRTFTSLPEACALATDEGLGLWAAGRPNASAQLGDDATPVPMPLGERKMDNHWSALAVVASGAHGAR
jgi:hypothetical protein